MMIESLKYMPHPKEANAALAEHFTDLAPALNARKAAIESSRCLYCYDAPLTLPSWILRMKLATSMSEGQMRVHGAS